MERLVDFSCSRGSRFKRERPPLETPPLPAHASKRVFNWFRFVLIRSGSLLRDLFQVSFLGCTWFWSWWVLAWFDWDWLDVIEFDRIWTNGIECRWVWLDSIELGRVLSSFHQVSKGLDGFTVFFFIRGPSVGYHLTDIWTPFSARGPLISIWAIRREIESNTQMMASLWKKKPIKRKSNGTKLQNGKN